ncbi:hypothetical protein HNR57_004972 [Streptomyces paradoxus]|uniref:Uncharacterized protein n=1 Tax=Streptomyces paradoxus TaxID=66375 RepID=A0A7W9TE48_9ACTN|nr:hypothetical protein [Streptomyces paradoxus]
MHGVVFEGRRHDTGDKADCLRAVVRPACERPDLGPEFVTWLRGVLGELDGAHPRAPGHGGLTCESPGTRPGSPHRGSPVSRWAAGSTQRSSRR